MRYSMKYLYEFLTLHLPPPSRPYISRRGGSKYVVHKIFTSASMFPHVVVGEYVTTGLGENSKNNSGELGSIIALIPFAQKDINISGSKF